MQMNFEFLNVLIFLFPGLISIIIFNSIVTVKERKIIRVIIDAFIFSFTIYIFSYIFNSSSPISLHETTINNETISSISFNKTSLYLILTLSVILPLILGILINNNLFSKLFRVLKISTKTSMISTWLDVFGDQRTYVIVNFKDGKRLYGWPMYYSSNYKEGHLYIQNPSWIENDKYIDLQIHGILILSEDIESIYFLNKTK